MGNKQSTKKNINLLQLINTVATNYILTQNFKDLQNLSDPEYCDKIIILTSDILSNRFNAQQIKYLSQRIKEGDVINNINTQNILYMKENDLRKLDIKSTIKKKRMCIGISKFYVKIAHLFSAIVTTINPQYKFRDESGKMRTIKFNERRSYSDKKLNLSKISLCSRRINSNFIEQLKDSSNNLLDDIVIKPKICDLNTIKLKNNDGTTNTKTMSLIDEPGIPELKQLYYDIYDYQTGKFTKMSENSKKAYNHDLNLFYKTFTGQRNMPDNIKNFSDIKLKDYHNNLRCKGNNAPLRQVITNNLKSSLIKNYAKQLQTMTNDTTKINNELIGILNEIFIYRLDPNTNNKNITINPKLNDELLDNIVVKARNIIVKLYLNCENEFMKSLNLFEAVVEEQIKKNTFRRIESLKKEKTRIISEL
jgi:hypothetical protein